MEEKIPFVQLQELKVQAEAARNRVAEVEKQIQVCGLCGMEEGRAAAAPPVEAPWPLGSRCAQRQPAVQQRPTPVAGPLAGAP
jgi:hypothetical protein